MNHKRTVKKHTILLHGKPEVLFPLLCPVREYEWIEPWKCDMIYSDSGFAEQDCIFQTDFPHDGPKDTCSKAVGDVQGRRGRSLVIEIT